MTAPFRYATTGRVALAWLGGVTGLSPGMIGDQPPADESSWAASGFITPNTVGGISDIYVPVVGPVVSLSCWAVSPDTGVPPWNLAFNLAETVRAACLSQDGFGAVLTLANCDQSARVFSAYLVGEPRRSWADAGDWASVILDVHIDWKAETPR
jgi:hypothetical protein